MKTIYVSVSEFRAQFPTLYQQHLKPDASQKASIVVRNEKTGQKLFGMFAFSSEEKKKQRQSNLQSIKKSVGKIKFDEKRVAEVRGLFDENLAARKKFHDTLTR